MLVDTFLLYFSPFCMCFLFFRKIYAQTPKNAQKYDFNQQLAKHLYAGRNTHHISLLIRGVI